MDCLKIKFLNKKVDPMKIQEQQVGLLKGNPKMDQKMYIINKDEDDEMKVYCYKLSKVKTFVTYLMFFLTCGILRLIFHWIPHWFLYATSDKCDINEAEKVLITELYNAKHKIYHVKKIQKITSQTIAKMHMDEKLLNNKQENTLNEHPTLSVHFEKGFFREIEKLIMFTCKKINYVWDPEKQEFVRLNGLDNGVSSETLHKSVGLTSNEQFTRRRVYGPNKILVKESSIVELLFLEVLNPFYIFQIASFILWFYDDYYYYAAAILAMSIFGITMSVTQIRQNQKKLKATVNSSDVCTVTRKEQNSVANETGECVYKSETISTDLLVPGDILEIPSHGCIMHCDAVLLTGNCILNESMLTGESVPVTKTPLPNIADISYDPKDHARHTLFCGTKIIQTRFIGNEKVLALVVRTGFSTAKGSLVRSILYPPPVDFRFEKDSYRFVALLSVVACLGFIYTVVLKVKRGVPLSQLIVEACDLITIVVPPALPAAMTVGRFYAENRLKKNKIFCISPRTINVSGSINCVCFDKTGTLTEDGLDLLCVAPIESKHFKEPVEDIEKLDYGTLLCGLVSCHSLTIIDKQIVGDPLDLKMFESTKWIMEEPDVDDNNKINMMFPTVFKPSKSYNSITESTYDLQIGIIREFPFSSSSQRMGVIVRKLTGQYYEYYCKGSPEMILNFVRPETVPDDFHDVLESYTQEGYRVIALAHKILKLSYTKVMKVQRDEIECDLTLLGLIVLENRLKPDTTPCIETLNEAEIRVIMVTGDNILTALSVAKDCGILTPGQSVIQINADNELVPNLYYTLTNTSKRKQLPNDLSILSNSASIMSLDTIESQIHTITSSVHETTDNKQNVISCNKNYNNNYRFAVTGKVWEIVRDYYPHILPKLVTRGNIFARMSPEHKQQLVQELQTVGYCVAMCGDGANDCGALKAAHTGISLSEAESSIASPFTSQNPNIQCVLKVIREGRAALVTSFGIFKYMAAYSLCQFISVIILYHIESNLTDMEFLYIDLAMISLFAFFFGKTAAYSKKLVKETPLSSLISFSPLLSLTIQVFLIILFQVCAFEHLRMMDWYAPFNHTVDDDESDGCLENYTIFTVSSFQYIILAIVFSKGKPYRKNIFTNYGFILSIIIMTSISIYLTLYPAEWIINSFELVLPEDFNFRLYLLFYGFANFLLSILIEYFLIDNLVFKKLRFKFHNLDKSKRKYLAIERDLNNDPKWPPITSEFKSTANSPLNPLIPTQTEIVVEREKFDKNHVLKNLYNLDTPSNFNVISSSLGNTPKRPTHNSFHLSYPNTPNRLNPDQRLSFEQNNESGFSQDDLLFSSLPSGNGISSQSDTFKSLSNNTSYDFANSQLNIEELPYDGVVVVQNNLSNFNSFGCSPPNNINLNSNKALEMDDFDNKR